MVDDNPVHAKSNKKPKEQSKSGMQASGRKGKSATGRGKKSRKCLELSVTEHLIYAAENEIRETL